MLYVVFIAASPSIMPTNEEALVGLSTAAVAGMYQAHIHSQLRFIDTMVILFSVPSLHTFSWNV